jgi:hypothetical protein
VIVGSIAHLTRLLLISFGFSATDVFDDTDDDRLPMGRHPLYESSRRLLGDDGQP